jgi:hypothetical protein
LNTVSLKLRMSIPVPLSMLEPPLSNTGELRLEPSGYDVHGDSAIAIVVDAGNLLCCDSWVPWPREEGSNDIELLGVVEEGLRERHRLVLVFLSSY